MSKKQSSPKKKQFTDLPIVRRKRNGDIEAEGLLRNTHIKLKVTATPEDWQEMNRRYTIGSRENSLNKDFYMFIAKADECINPLFEIPPKAKTNYLFVRELKVQAGLYYELINHWNKLPQEKQPRSFKEIGIPPGYETLLKNDPMGLTAYFMQNIYSSSLKNHNIKPFAVDAEYALNFEKTYVQDGVKMLNFKLSYTIDKMRYDFNSSFANIKIYKNMNTSDQKILDLLHNIMDAATLSLDSRLMASSEIVRIHSDITRIFPKVMRVFLFR